MSDTFPESTSPQEAARYAAASVERQVEEQRNKAQEQYHQAQERLPETYHFLNTGWWAIHLLAIPLIFGLGYMTAQRRS